MNATIQDICQATGFSTATVSRVLNDSPLVTPTTKKKVRAALDRMDYRPHHAARALKLNRTGMIAVVFPDFDNGFFTEVLRGVDETASEFKLHLMTAFTHGARDEQKLINRMIRGRLADALILMNLTFPDPFLRKLLRWNLPIVLIDRPLKGSSMSSVSIDNRAGTVAMTRHLLDQGHRRLVFVAGPAGTFDADERLAAFRDTLQAAGVPLPADAVWQGDFTEESSTRLMANFLLRNTPLPDAIFAANDAMAVGILRVLRQAGRQVPGDVAVVGFDGSDVARHLDLTTVRAPMRAMGREAAQQALHLIHGTAPPQNVVLPSQLVVRQTCSGSQSAKESPPPGEQS